MIETILLARDRKTGAYVPLSKFGDDWSSLKAALSKFHHEVHEEYDRIGLYQLVPQKKVLNLVSEKTAAAAAALRKSQTAEFEKVQALGKSSLEDLREIAAEMKLESVTAKSSRSEIAAAIVAAMNKGQKKPAPGGPTVAEFVAAGYDPAKYPPTGFESRSTPEEIAAAITEFKAKAAAQ